MTAHASLSHALEPSFISNFSRTTPQKDLGAVAVQVAPGQGIRPQPLWMRYCDLPLSLQHFVNDAMRSGGAERLLLETVVNCSPGTIFQVIGFIYEDGAIRLFPTEKEARLSE